MENQTKDIEMTDCNLQSFLMPFLENMINILEEAVMAFEEIEETYQEIFADYRISTSCNAQEDPVDNGESFSLKNREEQEKEHVIGEKKVQEEEKEEHPQDQGKSANQKQLENESGMDNQEIQKESEGVRTRFNTKKESVECHSEISENLPPKFIKRKGPVKHFPIEEAYHKIRKYTQFQKKKYKIAVRKRHLERNFRYNVDTSYCDFFLFKREKGQKTKEFSEKRKTPEYIDTDVGSTVCLHGSEDEQTRQSFEIERKGELEEQEQKQEKEQKNNKIEKVESKPSGTQEIHEEGVCEGRAQEDPVDNGESFSLKNREEQEKEHDIGEKKVQEEEKGEHPQDAGKSTNQQQLGNESGMDNQGIQKESEGLHSTFTTWKEEREQFYSEDKENQLKNITGYFLPSKSIKSKVSGTSSGIELAYHKIRRHPQFKKKKVKIAVWNPQMKRISKGDTHATLIQKKESKECYPEGKGKQPKNISGSSLPPKFLKRKNSGKSFDIAKTYHRSRKHPQFQKKKIRIALWKRQLKKILRRDKVLDILNCDCFLLKKTKWERTKEVSEKLRTPEERYIKVVPALCFQGSEDEQSQQSFEIERTQEQQKVKKGTKIEKEESQPLGKPEIHEEEVRKNRAPEDPVYNSESSSSLQNHEVQVKEHDIGEKKSQEEEKRGQLQDQEKSENQQELGDESGMDNQEEQESQKESEGTNSPGQQEYGQYGGEHEEAESREINEYQGDQRRIPPRKKGKICRWFNKKWRGLRKFFSCCSPQNED